MLTFKRIDVNAIDIQTQWVATNAVVEDVLIVLNTLNEYESWVEGEYVGSFDSFHEAKQAIITTSTLNWVI